MVYCKLYNSQPANIQPGLDMPCLPIWLPMSKYKIPSIKLKQQVVHVPVCGFICNEIEPDATISNRLKRPTIRIGFEWRVGYGDSSHLMKWWLSFMWVCICACMYVCMYVCIYTFNEVFYKIIKTPSFTTPLLWFGYHVVTQIRTNDIEGKPEGVMTKKYFHYLKFNSIKAPV